MRGGPFARTTRWLTDGGRSASRSDVGTSNGRASMVKARKEDPNERAREFRTTEAGGVRAEPWTAGASTGGGTLVNARGGWAPDGVSAVSRAQASFDDACADLDAAVLCLTEVEGETVMANAGLVALLLRVATARRHLTEMTRPTTPSPPASLR